MLGDIVSSVRLFIGGWSPTVGDMAGVRVPLIPWRHAYVVTERIEGIQNMPNVRDHDASLYLKLQGDALCVGGYEPNPVFLEDDKVGTHIIFFNSLRRICNRHSRYSFRPVFFCYFLPQMTFNSYL